VRRRSPERGRVNVWAARKTFEFELGLDAVNVKALVEAVRDAGTQKSPAAWRKRVKTRGRRLEAGGQRMGGALRRQGRGRAEAGFDLSQPSVPAFWVPSYIREALRHVLPDGHRMRGMMQLRRRRLNKRKPSSVPVGFVLRACPAAARPLPLHDA